MIFPRLRIFSLVAFYIFLPVSFSLVLPAATGAAPATYEVGPLHKNTITGSSSVFSFVNTGATTANYVIDFYWPNGQQLGNYGSFSLQPGGNCVDPCNASCAEVFDMSTAFIGADLFVGYAVISSDQPIDTCITTPDYGTISGTVFTETDTLPQGTDFISLSADNTWPNSLNTGMLMLLLD